MHKNKDIISLLNRRGSTICKLPNKQQWGLFSNPIKIIQTSSLSEINAVFDSIEELSKTKYICGFLSYEASPIFDKANKVAKSADFPLAWFAVYDDVSLTLNEEDFISYEKINDLTTEVSKSEYIRNINKIKTHIFEGDIYQANYTFRMTTKHIKEPAKLFLNLFHSHPTPYSSYINTGEYQIISNSPELFIERHNTEIISKPMKGTVARAFAYNDDLQRKNFLKNDKKNRAENLMIVDMVRNDFSRICKLNSIKVEPLFDIETYKTVHQMVSSVYGTLEKNRSLFNIFSSVFPAASITGSPKIKAMEIINSIEKSPRKIYTGTIGMLSPGGDFCFNVAIRTIINSQKNLELGIGGGIVSDSKAEDEWDEALLKSTFLNQKKIEFNLITTMLWTKTANYAFLDEHLQRLHNSQRYFDRPVNIEDIKKYLLNLNFSSNKEKVRVELFENGEFKVESTSLDFLGWGKDLLNIKISKHIIDTKNVFQYHKTINRNLYNQEFKSAICAGFDEVLFFNEHDNIAECAISNIFLKINNKWLTPNIKSGLLPGIWRQKMIIELNAIETTINREKLSDATEIIIGNSVRGKSYAKFLC